MSFFPSLYLCYLFHKPILQFLPMEKTPPRCKFSLIYFIIISLSLGLISFIFCIAAEIKRNKEEDLRWNGKLCSLPTSSAFGLGISALVSFSIAQIIGNATLIFKDSCSERKSSKIPAIAKVLLLISWVSYGIGVILLVVATSMSRKQVYGVGWLNGECYLVKRGTYAASAILVLVAIASVNGSALSSLRSSQQAEDQRKKIHKQIG